MSGGQRRLSLEKWGTVSLTMLLAVGFCPLLCKAAADDFSTWCSDTRTGGTNSVSVDVQCNNSLINLTMNFPDGRSLATNQDYYWLEYQCFLPNDTTVVEAKIPNPEDYGAVLPNYTQPFEDAPLPDGTVCTVRGCFYQTGSSIYRFIVPNNCTVDTDECAKETHDCGGNSLCNNTVGGYECVCEDGYSPLDDRNCIDTDECAKETHDCGGNSLCNNTVGGYECVCEDGYSPLDDRNCIDTDECVEETHDCGGNSLCNNTVGGYECVCEDGYSPLDGRNVNCTGLVPTSVTLPVTASITAEFAALEFAALDTASETISMDVLGTPRPAREVREPGLTVGLTLALILTLLLVVLVTALSLFIAWRRHKRQRARRFRHYKFNVESKLDVMYDPGVLKLDATFTVHSSVGSIFHELTYEREMCSYSPTPHTPVVKDETRIKNKAAEGDDAGAADTDVAHAEKKNEGDEESNSSSLESGKGTNSESPRQSFLVNAASGGDDNSCPLSPFSIALELGTNDSNSSSGRSRAASLRQSCGDARSTVGYVSETTNGLSHTTGSGGGATITSNQWEIPVFEDLTWQPSPANVDSGVEFRATGYVSEPNELRVTSTFSGGPATPLPTGKEDCQMGTSGHRNLWSRYTSDSSGGVGCPSGYVTRETTMTVREREQQPAQQPAHPPGKQMTHETSAERTRRQRQQHRIEHQECSEQHNIQQKQQQIEQQQQQRQQNQQQARIERAVSSLSLNIITDLEQAFPLASRFASYESLYLPESLPQLMPTKPDSPPLVLGSTSGRGEGRRGGAGYVDDNLSATLFVTELQLDTDSPLNPSPTAQLTTNNIEDSTRIRTSGHTLQYGVSPYTPHLSDSPTLFSQSRHNPPDPVPFEKSANLVQPTRPLRDYINLENNPRTPKSSPPNGNITLPGDSKTVSTDAVGISDTVERRRECVAVCDSEPCSRTSSPGMGSGLDDLFSDENMDERGFANILFGLETSVSEDYV